MVSAKLVFYIDLLLLLLENIYEKVTKVGTSAQQFQDDKWKITKRLCRHWSKRPPLHLHIIKMKKKDDMILIIFFHRCMIVRGRKDETRLDDFFLLKCHNRRSTEKKEGVADRKRRYNYVKKLINYKTKTEILPLDKGIFLRDGWIERREE